MLLFHPHSPLATIIHVPFRYFYGVQNDPTKRGELFGIENIFKLHEHTLATKMAVCNQCEMRVVAAEFCHQIEKAHLAEFDWALAHMDGKPSDKKHDDDDLGLDNEAKLRVDDVCPDIHLHKIRTHSLTV